MQKSLLNRLFWVFGSISFCVLLGFGLHRWIVYSPALHLSNVIINGNELLGTDEILKLIPVGDDQKITEVNLEEIEKALEAHPYIETALVSRKFPSALRIDLVERKPVAFIAGSRLFVVDEEGVLLPNRKSSALSGLPVITGIKMFREEIGKPIASPNVLRAIELFNMVRATNPELYYKLSEIHYDIKKGFLAYFTDARFPVYFGFDRFYEKTNKLDAFFRQVKEENRYGKLRYVDLRYREQVVANFRK